jgi:hypothetical protein
MRSFLVHEIPSDATRAIAAGDKRVLHSEEPTTYGDLRVVSFASKVLIRENQAFYNSNDTWFTKEEIQNFKKDCHRPVHTITHMAMASIDCFPDVCDRGLENTTKAALIQSTTSRRNYSTRSVVLNLQEAQRKSGVFDPEKISNEYRRASAKSCFMARAMGRVTMRSKFKL